MSEELGSTEREIVAQRVRKADELRKLGVNPFGNGHAPAHLAVDLIQRYGDEPADQIATHAGSWSVAGRVLAIRSFGKAAFLKVRDRSGEIQLWVKKDKVGDAAFDVFKLVDVGDVVAGEGPATRTKTGELTVEAQRFTVLTKSIRPLPEKWHGLTDVEERYRRRYVDLIATPGVRETFQKRARIVSTIRRFLDERGYLEVETPTLHKPEEAGGAAARPFETHHNALDLDLKLRIATELHLKRLVVGGLERVYEIGRIWRNEGIDRRHNPEFTSIEFYQAYATHEDLMRLNEELFHRLAVEVTGSPVITFQGQRIDFTPPFPRVSLVAEGARALGLSVEDALAGCAPVARGGPRHRLRGLRRARAAQGPARLRGRLPARDEPALAPPRLRSAPGRPLRAVRGRDGARERLQRAQRSHGPARPLRGADEGQGSRRRGGDAVRRGLRARARARHAAHRRRGHRHRPAHHAPHRLGVHPRRHPLPTPEEPRVGAEGVGVPRAFSTPAFG